MHKKIIVINGSGGKGKDTFLEYCGVHSKVKNVSSIDPAKDALEKLVGYTRDDEKLGDSQGERLRALLSELKRLSIEYNDYPYRYIVGEINSFKQSDDELLFIHIREPKEIKRIVDYCECTTVLIVNSNVPDITSNESDACVYDMVYDYIIDNSGKLSDLELQATKFIANLCKTS